MVGWCASLEYRKVRACAQRAYHLLFCFYVFLYCIVDAPLVATVCFLSWTLIAAQALMESGLQVVTAKQPGPKLQGAQTSAHKVT